MNGNENRTIKSWYNRIYENYTVAICLGMFVGIIAAISAFTYCGMCFFGNKCNLEAILVSSTIALTTVCCICVIIAVVYTLFCYCYDTCVDWRKEREFQHLISNASSIEYD